MNMGRRRGRVSGKEAVRQAMLSLAVLLSLLSMGCIDLELMDWMLPSENEIYVTHEIVLKKSLFYYFNTTLMAPPSQLRKDVYNQEFRIMEDSEWMKIDISVQLDKNDLIQDILRSLGINETLTRHVIVTFTDPKNRVWFHREFYDTISLEPQLVYSPEPGIWTVDISAKGIGGEYEGFELKDGFDVRVYALEPVYH